MTAHRWPTTEAAKDRRLRLFREILTIMGMAAVYFGSGKLGLSLAYLNKSATPVWPPTGLSIAALLLLGHRIWPGIFLGALLVNLTVTSLPVSIGIALGNTLEPLAGAWLARRWAHGRFAFRNPRDILRYIAGVALLSTTLSATIGVASLAVGGYASNTSIAPVWLTWWLGDMVSALIVAPLLLIWSTSSPVDWFARRHVEAALIFVALIIVGLFVFSGVMNPLPSQSAWRFLCFPAMLWASYRFGPQGAITSSAIFCAIAIGSAALGLSPMSSESPNTSLLMLQAFMATVTLTNLILGAVTEERRRVEDALRASRQQLQLITDSMSAPVTRCGRDLTYRWVSRPYAEWLRLSPEEIINRPIVEVIGPEAFGRLKPFFDRVLAGEIVSYEHEVNFAGIGPRWIHAVYSPSQDAAGKIDGWVAVIIDIHERIQIQKTLQEADRRKDEFLAILAHELRNPLAPVRTAVALLERVAKDNPDVLELRETIDRQVTQMARLLDDLLDVSRITSGKINMRRERITLREVVNAALESSRPLIEDRNHRLTLTIPAETILLDADLTRLSQVFSNLLNNAAKYTEHGGHIRLSAEADKDHAIVRVLDNGIGIPPTMLAHVFDMFVQVDPASETTHGGLGIGLTLVRRLVEAHGGSVEARSEGLDKGSEFVVTLPRAPVPEAPEPESDAGPVTAAAQRLRILVADDNVDSATLLKRLLGMMGHEVRTAYDGLEAFEIAKSFRPHAALLDIGMPKLNGYELARKIREDSNGASILLVAMTGWGQDEDKRRSKEAGFDEHLTKPMEFDAIESVLRMIPEPTRRDCSG